jgi:hypothetical protein
MVNQIIKHKTNEPSIRFINVQNGEIYADISKPLSEGLWRDLSPENYEHNVMQGLLNRPNCKPVLKDILPIYPEMKWNSEKIQLQDPYFIPLKRETSLKDFLIAAELFFTKYSNKKIGVQLSGGLDSSIIIALLKHFGIPFSLIGMSSSQYEFRSEKHIQNILAEWSSEVSLLDYEKHLPLFDIDKIPAFQYPDMLCLNYSADNAMALECERLGVDILLTGNGGDNVFADNVPENPELSTWLPQIFTDTWLNDIVYAPKGVQLIPFFGDKQIMQTLYNLRLGQPEDNAKLWARNFFRDFIPQELVNYTYCADFWGLYIDGLQKSIPTVHKLFNRAYDLTNHSCFSKKSINELFDQDLLNAHKSMYQKIEARISLAVWLNSLIK